MGMREMISHMERARVVVIGGGIAGCSVAYHLAKAGWQDVVLLEKAELTSGSTHHAAGLVTQFNPSSTMMRFRRYSVELYRELGVFEAVGSVRIASSEASLLELRRAASAAAGIGLEAELISPAEVLERLPEAGGAPILGAVWMPGDGHVDPHIATHAVADAARALGVEHPAADPRHRHRARPAPRGARRAHRRRVDRDRARRRRGRHLGAAGGGDGGRVRPVRAGRPPARRDAGRRRARDPARRAVLPRPRQPRLRQAGGRRAAHRRLRAGPARALDRRRAVGPRRQPGRVGHGPLRAAARGRHPPVPVPRGRGRRAPALPPGRDDARRQPAARARCRACAASGSPPASRSTASAARAGWARRWPSG